MKKTPNDVKISAQHAVRLAAPHVSLLLHDVRSVHNVGSIFRTADAFGVVKIYCSGYTPRPTDRFGRTRQDLAKVALGAEKSVAWEYVDNVVDFLKEFKKSKGGSGGIVIAIEQDSKSIDYRKVKDRVDLAGKQNVLLILGNEVSGIDKNLLDEAGIIAEIPMKGKKESLNVSVAAGIALFGMFD
jgi:tRNA G18 (ribose-2'-O)-methylase SpoU